jgi:methylmalonyl-CoA/ethylmalonyl-CoA epimerase
MSDDLSQPADGAALSGIDLRGIDHIGMAVNDLDEAISRYESLFGMRCVHVEENAEQGVREAMMSIGPDPRPTTASSCSPR